MKEAACLVARHNELDAGPAERLDDIEIPFNRVRRRSARQAGQNPSCAASWHTAQLQLDID
jgi:hypothetical protein